jgi:hypothetical protein
LHTKVGCASLLKSSCTLDAGPSAYEFAFVSLLPQPSNELIVRENFRLQGENGRYFFQASLLLAFLLGSSRP